MKIWQIHEIFMIYVHKAISPHPTHMDTNVTHSCLMQSLPYTHVATVKFSL